MASNTQTDSSSSFQRASQRELSPMEDPRSPFFLHHGETPSAILVTKPLTEDNYPTWARAMRMALDAKSKLGFVDASVIYRDTAFEVWNTLKKRFSQANGPRISQLQKQISTMMQGAATVTGFFTDLQAAWDQLLNFRPSPCCSCGKCTCGVNDKITAFQHQDALMQFLNGLNDSYSQVRTQILMMEPSPSIDKAFSLMIQEEQQRCLGFAVAPSVESTALAMKNQGFNQGNSFPGNNSKNFKGNNTKGRSVCSHCGKVGHVMEKCYKLIGFPPGYKQKGRVAMANQVLVEGDQGTSDIQQANPFPFTSEQYQ
ncbi:uncharacterized protein LOC142606025 [Castanea sativa]|uniref:uncharacterized protein LOC142606025 n=1 Tax=Castanea sativa TaxID=21020 RepID=UPI003F64F0E3